MVLPAFKYIAKYEYLILEARHEYTVICSTFHIFNLLHVGIKLPHNLRAQKMGYDEDGTISRWKIWLTLGSYHKQWIIDFLHNENVWIPLTLKFKWKASMSSSDTMSKWLDQLKAE
jgi:hypothetical protein